MKDISFLKLFEAMDQKQESDNRRAQETVQSVGSTTAIHRHMHSYAVAECMNGLKRMQMCRQALEALDRYPSYYYCISS